MAMQSVIPRRDLRDLDTTATYPPVLQYGEPVPEYGEVDPAVVCAGICLVLVGLALAT